MDTRKLDKVSGDEQSEVNPLTTTIEEVGKVEPKGQEPYEGSINDEKQPSTETKSHLEWSSEQPVISIDDKIKEDKETAEVSINIKEEMEPESKARQTMAPSSIKTNLNFLFEQAKNPLAPRSHTKWYQPQENAKVITVMVDREPFEERPSLPTRSQILEMNHPNVIPTEPNVDKGLADNAKERKKLFYEIVSFVGSIFCKTASFFYENFAFTLLFIFLMWFLFVTFGYIIKIPNVKYYHGPRPA